MMRLAGLPRGPMAALNWYGQPWQRSMNGTMPA
jgi:hypothetical protein